MPCLHCGGMPANRPRGLCHPCYKQPEVRSLYPANLCWKICPRCGGVSWPKPESDSNLCCLCRTGKGDTRVKPLPQVSPDTEIDINMDREIVMGICQARVDLEAPTDNWGYRKWKAQRQQRHARNGTSG